MLILLEIRIAINFDLRFFASLLCLWINKIASQCLLISALITFFVVCLVFHSIKWPLTSIVRNFICKLYVHLYAVLQVCHVKVFHLHYVANSLCYCFVLNQS